MTALSTAFPKQPLSIRPIAWSAVDDVLSASKELARIKKTKNNFEVLL